MKNGEQPAYPSKAKNESAMIEKFRGLSKRELVAAMAMQGLLSIDDENYYVNNHALHTESVAKDAVAMADALLKELSNP